MQFIALLGVWFLVLGIWWQTTLVLKTAAFGGLNNTGQ